MNLPLAKYSTEGPNKAEVHMYKRWRLATEVRRGRRVKMLDSPKSKIVAIF